jgi:hypothetical protein
MTRRCIGLVIVALSLVACPSAAAQVVTITAPPQLPSVALVGDRLEATPGEWSPPVPAASYQWLRCNLEGSACVPIDGETTLSYTVVAADEDGTLRIRLTVNLAPGDDPPPSAESNPTLVPRPPTNEEDPAVAGTPREGQVLSASRGEWTGTPPLNFAVQWKRCNTASGTACAPISGATSDTYVLTAADVGARLLVAVTASNAAGAVTIESALTEVIGPAPLANIQPPEVVGVAQVGASLRATTGRWVPSGPIEFLYRWLRCRADGSDCIPIPGAVGASYEVRPLDVGSRLRVRVTAVSDAGSSAQDSALTSVVTAPLGVIAPGQAPPELMRPFPSVRIKGYFTRSGAVLQLVTVRGPRVARIALTCWGRDCPFRERDRPLRRRVRIRALERSFRAGTRIVIRVTKARRIGKHTRIVIRAGRPPARRDRCLMPGSLTPMQCPPSP